MDLSEEPAFTELYDRVDEFRPVADCVYVFAQSVEERSEHTASWALERDDITFVEISIQEPTAIKVRVAGDEALLSLRSEEQLSGLWKKFDRKHIYLDITGLAHHVWAALLKSCLKVNRQVQVVYVEPKDYSFSSAPTEGQIFDLSTRINGIAPLPGFASLANTRHVDSWFIPLLGFEGTRLSYVVEHVQPSNDRIIPVIGVPGFRPEYPFHTYLGNKRALLETAAWHRVEYVKANCPFGIFYLLERISAESPRALLRVAPIGTKPHALGAVLFKIIGRRQLVELIYDHPIRKPDRTRGSDHLLVYDVYALSVLNREREGV